MKKIIIISTVILLTACAQFKLVKTEPINVHGITILPETTWNKSPWDIGKNTQVWTADGHSLNELIFIGNVKTGEKLFKANNKELPMPSFDASMLPNELQDLITSSIKNLMGGKISINAQNVRPQEFSGNMGFRFNVSFFTEDGLEKKGDIIMAIKDDQLFAIAFIAAKLHYFSKYEKSVDQMFKTAKI